MLHAAAVTGTVALAGAAAGAEAQGNKRGPAAALPTFCICSDKDGGAKHKIKKGGRVYLGDNKPVNETAEFMNARIITIGGKDMLEFTEPLMDVRVSLPMTAVDKFKTKWTVSDVTVFSDKAYAITIQLCRKDANGQVAAKRVVDGCTISCGGVTLHEAPGACLECHGTMICCDE
jgi:hypothetical protein